MKHDRGSRHRDPPPRAAWDGPYRMPSRSPNPAVLGELANAIPVELLKAVQNRIGRNRTGRHRELDATEVT